MLTPVSKSASVLPFTNPVMEYVKAGSVAPYTFEIPEVAVTVNGYLVVVTSTLVGDVCKLGVPSSSWATTYTS